MSLHNPTLGNKARKINDADFATVPVTGTRSQELQSRVDFHIC